jgi:hopene-associated glycosyltransferase HpnB
MTPELVAGALATIAWLALLLLPSRPYSTRERLYIDPVEDAADLSGVTVIVPARNEARQIAATLAGLAGQGAGLAVIVVDDESTDSTTDVAVAAGRAHESAIRLSVVGGAPLPAGWGGKLWALEQGLARTDSEWVLLLDADIVIAPGVVSALLDQARRSGSDLVSVMADLRCVSFWERLLVPPFVYFFKLLYPFRRVADPASRVAAAAGGCVLVRMDALRAVSAFGSLRGALIDDCTLARLVKQSGRRLWLGLGHGVVSHRQYGSLGSFAAMIARTAFTQLRYSATLLVLVSMLMGVVFAGPLLAVWSQPNAAGIGIGLAGLVAMLAAYAPVQRWYAMPLPWLLTLPLAAVLYLGMTWLSAIHYWRGTRARWKGRAYAVE